jgi:hypothetical protein
MLAKNLQTPLNDKNIRENFLFHISEEKLEFTILLLSMFQT